MNSSAWPWHSQGYHGQLAARAEADGLHGPLAARAEATRAGKPPVAPPPTLKLYHNDGKGRFTDVTAGSGLDVSMYAMGVAVGDYDNDGLVDVFLSGVGGNRLFRTWAAASFATSPPKPGWGETAISGAPVAGSSITTMTANSTCSSATTYVGRARPI